MAAGHDNDRNYCGEVHTDWTRMENKGIVHKKYSEGKYGVTIRGTAIIILFF